MLLVDECQCMYCRVKVICITGCCCHHGCTKETQYNSAFFLSITLKLLPITQQSKSIFSFISPFFLSIYSSFLSFDIFFSPYPADTWFVFFTLTGFKSLLKFWALLSHFETTLTGATISLNVSIFHFMRHCYHFMQQSLCIPVKQSKIIQLWLVGWIQLENKTWHFPYILWS